MKKIFLILVITVFHLFFLDVYAIDKCTTDEYERLKELANNIEFKRTYEINEEESLKETETLIVKYNIEILNTNTDIKIKYQLDDLEKEEVVNNQILNIQQGRTLTFYIYSYTDNLCTDELLKKISIDLPIYNSYYYFNKEKCDDAFDFKYCKEFLSIGETSFSEIDELYDKYISENQNIELKTKDNFYIYIISLFVIIFLIFIVVFIIKKNLKNKDL